MRYPRPARPRSVDVHWRVLGLLSVGFAVLAAAGRLARWNVDATLAACATWLTLILLALAVRNLVVVTRRGRLAVLSPLQRIPALVAGSLPLAAFLAGIGAGRRFWH